MEKVRNVLWAWMSRSDSASVQGEFDRLALALFRWQAQHNDVYREFVHLIGIQPLEVDAVDDTDDPKEAAIALVLAMGG